MTASPTLESVTSNPSRCLRSSSVLRASSSLTANNARSARNRAMRTNSAVFSAVERKASVSAHSISIGTSLATCALAMQHGGRQIGADDARPDLRKGGIARRRRIVVVRRKAAVIGRAELFDGNVAYGFQDAIPDQLGRLDSRVARHDDADEYLVMRLDVSPDDFENPGRVRRAGDRNIEIDDIELKYARKQGGTVQILAVGALFVDTMAGVHPQVLALAVGELGKREIVQIDEALEKSAGRIEAQRKGSLGEIDLDLVGPLLEAAPNLFDMLLQKGLDERFARIGRDSLVRIHQAQRRRGNHRLLQRNPCVAQG